MPEITELKKWCDEARRILKLMGKDSRGKMAERNADVVKLLGRLEQIPEMKEDYARLRNEYESVAIRARVAGEKKDQTEVANASRDLSILKNTLRIKLAEDLVASEGTLKSGEKAEKRLKSKDKEQWAEEFEGRKEDLRIARQKLLDKFVDPVFATGTVLQALEVERQKAITALKQELPTPQEMEDADAAREEFERLVEQERKRVVQQRTDVMEELKKLIDPPGADTEETNAIKAERERVLLALALGTPKPDDFVEAEQAIVDLKRLIAHSAKLSKLAAKNPNAALAARSAFKDFRATIGNIEITDEVVNDAKRVLDERQVEFDDALEEWRRADELPEGTLEEQKTKQEEIRRTEEAYFLAQNARDAAAARENAILGQKFLTEAVTHGPLSPESGRPFSGTTAEKFINGYKKDARLADSAVRTATTAKFPEAIANGLDAMISNVASGMAADDGADFPAGQAREYGEQLLKMGGDVGGEFFSRLPEYLKSGHQFDVSPLQDFPASSFSELAQKRSVTLASTLIKTDGTIDVDSTAAKEMIGNMLFHPDAMANPTPAMNAHILETLKFLGNSTTGPQASNVLKGTKAPTNPSGLNLVRTALGKGESDSVTDHETRTSVLASMLKPMTQGPVGSCFSTAPTRKMRQTQPLNAMKAFSEIASKGTYKPANGDRVPAVTNVPPGEDPIQRSWEYSLATSTARNGNSNETNAFLGNMAKGVGQFQAVEGSKDKAWIKKESKLKNDIKSSFTFLYDPLSEITDSNDGSSSQGRYVVKTLPGGKEIRTRDDFVQEMAKVAIKSLGIEPTSPKAEEVRKMVKTDTFVNAVCPGKYKPWELESGGQTEQATRTLFGPGAGHFELLAKAPDTGKPTEGERTKQIITGFLNSYSGRTDQMVTMTSISMHGFNGLPNHPSLAGLKGSNPVDTAQKIQTNLVDKGTLLKDTDLTAEHAAWMFDQEMEKIMKDLTEQTQITALESGIKSKRPTGPMKPAALSKVISEALDGYHNLLADKLAKDWEQEQTVQPVDPLKVAEQKTKNKEALVTETGNASKSLLMREMGAPEFVVADTNWGDSLSHTYFVIAPDPTTGEPLLWKKEEPPGILRAAGREWVDDQWTRID